MKLNLLTFVCLFISCYLGAKSVYVSPNGKGDGSSESSPLGSFSEAVKLLAPGDELILLDGEYNTSLVINGLEGTATDSITIKANNLAKAHINGQTKLTHAIEITNGKYLKIDGIVAGNTLHTAWKINNCQHVSITRCAGYNAGYLRAQDGHVDNSYDDNCHIFGIAYSDQMLAEDVWAWGTGRYAFLYFQCTNSIVRRGVFRPTAPELGYGYDRCPHSGFNLYDCDKSLAENCIAFETRVHPQSDHNANNPWGLVQGGMVFDDHTLPSGYNRVIGCFDLDNGQWRNQVERSNPAVHLMSKWSGELEDVVIWKNALSYGINKGTTGTVKLPERALIGSPDQIRQNTLPENRINYRYINGELTDQPLWPWPYEEVIRQLMGMDETMTEYVSRMLAPFLEVKPAVVQSIHPNETSAIIGPNFPNPLQPGTSIPVELKNADHLSIVVYDLEGKEVAIVLDKMLNAGKHEIHWDGTDSQGKPLNSGTYLIKVSTSISSSTFKTMVIK